MLILPKWTEYGVDPETYWKGPLEVEWSLTFPVGEEPRPEVVRRIRSFYPAYVPLWVTRVHLHPDGRTKVPFHYHVIGRWRECPDPDRGEDGIISGLMRPADFPFKGGVIYEQSTLSSPWPDHSPQKYVNTPDFPLRGPVDQGLADYMEAAYKEARGVTEKLTSRLKRLEKQKETDNAEELQKLHDDKQYELMQFRQAWNRAISEGRLFDIPKKHEPQPYAFLG